MSRDEVLARCLSYWHNNPHGRRDGVGIARSELGYNCWIRPAAPLRQGSGGVPLQREEGRVLLTEDRFEIRISAVTSAEPIVTARARPASHSVDKIDAAQTPNVPTIGEMLSMNGITGGCFSSSPGLSPEAAALVSQNINNYLYTVRINLTDL